MFGLAPSEIKMIKGVFEKFPQVHEVVIYGSRAKGNFKPYSDIDLSLIGNDLSQKVLFRIELSLDDLMLPLCL
ncbi:nucleotidyltransferase domain-containing protein [Chryseobacterium salipaludis]|uniref:nucleotidyltransferase domain-containing protein n=2 Tax=Chryseobacterium TaxID=59732 RepID=UPI0031B879B9